MVVEKMISSIFKGILFDTSFLIEAVRHPSSFSHLEDVYRGFPFYISESILNELLSMAKYRSGSRSKRARLILEYIDKSSRFKIIKSISKKADEDIVLLARRNSFIVATGDRDIRKKLMNKGIKIIYLKDSYPLII